MRVGDAERWAVDAQLQQAVGEGLLTLPEYEERAAQVWASRTRGELETVTRDLPIPPPAPAPARVEHAGASSGRARRAVGVMSGDRLSGPVAPGQPVEAYALMGGVVVDLRRDDLPSHVHVRAVAVMGGIEVLVPRGVEVHLSGASLMGGREVKVDVPRPGAPVVEVQAYALMGGVEVKHGGAPRPDEQPAAVAHEVPPPRTAVAAPLHTGSAPLHAGSRAVARTARPRRRRGIGELLLLAALLGGGVAASQQDVAAVFGSSVYHASVGEDVDVAALFGSVTVVVPDGAQVRSNGVVVFGSADCDACGAGGGPGSVGVDGNGAFGSIEVLDETMYAQRQAGDDPDD